MASQAGSPVPHQTLSAAERYLAPSPSPTAPLPAEIIIDDSDDSDDETFDPLLVSPSTDSKRSSKVQSDLLNFGDGEHIEEESEAEEGDADGAQLAMWSMGEVESEEGEEDGAWEDDEDNESDLMTVEEAAEARRIAAQSIFGRRTCSAEENALVEEEGQWYATHGNYIKARTAIEREPLLFPSLGAETSAHAAADLLHLLDGVVGSRLRLQYYDSPNRPSIILDLVERAALACTCFECENGEGLPPRVRENIM